MAGETYVKRYGTGFTDADAAKPVDAQTMNALEAALLRLLGEDPAADELGVWTPGSGRFVFQKITNAHIDAAAAIDKSKLAPLAIVDADVAGGAAIAKSKLAALAIVNADIDAAAEIVVTKLLEGSNGQFLKTASGAPAWAAHGLFTRGVGVINFPTSQSATQITVTHGAGATPIAVLLTAEDTSDSAIIAWVSAIGATTFDIDAFASQASINGDRNIHWLAVL